MDKDKFLLHLNSCIDSLCWKSDIAYNDDDVPTLLRINAVLSFISDLVCEIHLGTFDKGGADN